MTVFASPTTLTYVEAADFVTAAAGSLDRLPSDGGPSPASGHTAGPASGAVAPAASGPAGASSSPRRMDVDLAPLVRFDSSAIAAFIAIERRAVERGVELRFLNAPANLRKLATLYAVDSLIFGG